MIAEKILGNIHSDKVGVPVDTVGLEWFEADGKRLRKTSSPSSTTKNTNRFRFHYITFFFLTLFLD